MCIYKTKTSNYKKNEDPFLKKYASLSVEIDSFFNHKARKLVRCLHSHSNFKHTRHKLIIEHLITKYYCNANPIK